MKISIITVCYNSEKTIARTIESILTQNYSNIEYLIIDGASKDNTITIVDSYKDQFLDKKIDFKVISEPDKGIYDAMNKGIEKSSGEIIGILNSDDHYASSEILDSVNQVFSNNKIDSCYGNILYTRNSKPYRYWKSGKPRTFKFGWMPPHPAFFVRKDVYCKYGNFRLDCGTAADYELMLRFLQKEKISSVWINQIFTFMEAGGASNSGINSRKEAYVNEKKAWKINNLGLNILTLWCKKIRKISQFFIPKKIKTTYNLGEYKCHKK